ncbi:transporter substrate-binding domain-containing protein [Pseudomonas sp. 1912-s]|uniref:transporter substrate-binding domain-containing protein n=1 Tax=Pseudomonas sp. 1912-s TaxID=3033802 RepID=UPI0023DEEF06|nr:transporter substrate-binding domain-containing protein [Pseudomonas sp. 1912-s]MDF3202846.1 transporter substrate-binding domain-containing protein [Pseudomonas sp. 1912-s]
MSLSDADWRWLRNKRVLRLGVSLTDAAPFSLVDTGSDYEGVTADYAEMLSDLLTIDVAVFRYAGRTQAIEALKRGEIDFIGTTNNSEARDADLVTSYPYIQDPNVFIVRRDRTKVLPAKLEGERVAISGHFQFASRLKENYPLSKLHTYSTDIEAISSVIFGKSDIYMGSMLTSRYLISRNLLSELRLETTDNAEINDISFTLRSGDPQLLRVINVALTAIPTSENLAVMHRWGRNARSLHAREDFELSPKERRWIDEHRQIRVAVNEDIPPISFFNKNNQLTGINFDVLEQISSITALHFEVVRGSNTNDLEELVRTGKADFMMGFNHHSEQEKDIRFTRPYLTTPYVMITRNRPNQPANLDSLIGKKLALPLSNADLEYIKYQYPKVALINTSGTVDAMEKVSSGIADAAIVHLIRANYLVANTYQDRIKVSGIVGTQPSRMGIGTASASVELYSILEKALKSISPEEMDDLLSHWRAEVMVDNTAIRANQLVTLRGFAIGAVLLFFAICWIFYLRRLIKLRDAAESALNEQMEFMRVLIDGLPHPIYVRDSQTRMLLCNSKYLEIAGSQLEEIIGTRPTEGLSIDSKYSLDYEKQYHEVMAEGKERVQDCQMMMPDGRLTTVYHWILPFRNSTGEIKGIIAGWIDITERENLLKELKNAKMEADDANRAKTSFLATMSHEIRTPMNAVVGMLELAMKKAEQGVLDRFAIEVASGAAQGMLELIGDILDVVRIESGRLTLNPQRAQFKALVEAVLRVFEGLARQKHLALVLDFDELANKDVLIDSLRFKQILSNLLSNAIKFTEAGKVLVSVDGKIDQQNQLLDIRLLVRDTGIGITLEDQAKLFTAFSQVNIDGSSSSGGAGLGLMISRTLCAMMQGELILSSVPGLGTLIEVQITLPVLDPLPPMKSEVSVVSARQLNVLVVDDYPANRLLLSQQLSYLGHNVCDEPDGVLGLKSWCSNDFDVVITDCNMPAMNGYELARAIRIEEENSKKHTCVILGFTANAQLEEIDRCLEAGMDDCLFKPISMDDLNKCLLKVQPLPGKSRGDEANGEVDESIDISSLEKLSSGNSDFVKKLLHDLSLSNEQDLHHLLELFSAHNLEGLSELAHRIKGGARIIKAKHLIQCCEKLQADCTELDCRSLTESVDALHQAMEALQKKLRL